MFMAAEDRNPIFWTVPLRNQAGWYIDESPNRDRRYRQVRPATWQGPVTNKKFKRQFPENTKYFEIASTLR